MKKSDGGLRKIWRERMVGGFDWQSVEAGAIGKGIPDMNYCAVAPPMPVLAPDGLSTVTRTEGREGWVENKWTGGWVVSLEPEQVAWITRRVRHGGLVTVAVRRRCEAGPRRAAADELYLFRGSHARLIRDSGLRPFAPTTPGKDAYFDPAAQGLLYSGAGGPARWDWQRVRAALLRRPDPWSDELAG